MVGNKYSEFIQAFKTFKSIIQSDLLSLIKSTKWMLKRDKDFE